MRIRQFVFTRPQRLLGCLVVCLTILNSGCNSCLTKHHGVSKNADGTPAVVNVDDAHVNSAKGLEVAVKEMVTVVNKALADLPAPPSAPAVCEYEMAKLREVLETAPGSEGAANANAGLLRCTAKATNETKCKGKAQPCGVVYYNPPIKMSDSSRRDLVQSEPKAVDVAVPDQISAACRDIAGAGDDGQSPSTSPNPATGTVLGSMVGNYSCGAWLKAAAQNNPTMLVIPLFVPTIQLVRDLRSYEHGVVDVTPEAVLATSVKRVNATLVTMRIGGKIVPAALLLIVPVGGTPGAVVDGARKILQQRVAQVAKAVEDDCRAVDVCR